MSFATRSLLDSFVCIGNDAADLRVVPKRRS